MTAPEINGPVLRGMLGRLMAVVRPEFRSNVLEFPADDLVFGAGACRVPGCQRSARGHGFCQGHGQRWVDAGRPDPDVFAATTDPRWRRQQPNQRCAVDSCGYGTARGGLCSMHARRWEHAGRPDRDRWLAAAPAVKQPAAGAVCRIEHCLLWPQASSPFCHAHTNAWRCHGRPDPGEFADGFVPTGSPSGIWPISTPAGPGFDFIVTDQAVTPWGSNTKAILAKKSLTSPIGNAEKWTFNMYLPKQSLTQDWQAGVLWEFHTDSSSGIHLALAPDGTFRIARQSAYGQIYSYTSGGPVPWDRWVPVEYDVKWSLGSDGYLRVSIDGKQYLNYSGPTVFANDGDPVLQFGFYSRLGAGLTNEVRFSDIRVQKLDPSKL